MNPPSWSLPGTSDEPSLVAKSPPLGELTTNEHGWLSVQYKKSVVESLTTRKSINEKFRGGGACQFPTEFVWFVGVVCFEGLILLDPL